MRTFWLALLIGSALSLLYILWRRQVPKGWFARFGVHLVAAAVAIYVLNFSGVAVAGAYVPLNPATVGTVAVLGVPGIALVLGLQWTLLA